MVAPGRIVSNEKKNYPFHLRDAGPHNALFLGRVPVVTADGISICSDVFEGLTVVLID